MYPNMALSLCSVAEALEDISKLHDDFNEQIEEITSGALSLLMKPPPDRDHDQRCHELVRALVQLNSDLNIKSLSQKEAFYIIAIITSIDAVLPDGMGLESTAGKRYGGKMFTAQDLRDLCWKAGLNDSLARKKGEVIKVLMDFYDHLEFLLAKRVKGDHRSP